MALLIGSIFSFILFAGSIQSFIVDHSQFHAVVTAISVSLQILAMVLTDTEHPPASGIAIGMSNREWTVEVFGAVLGAIVLLGIIKMVFRRYLCNLL